MFGFDDRKKVDLRGVRDMASLQAFVAQTCNSLGVDPATGGLRMQYVDAGGVTRTVSRSTQIEDVCHARELLMVPKSEAAKAGDSAPERREGVVHRVAAAVVREPWSGVEHRRGARRVVLPPVLRHTQPELFAITSQRCAALFQLQFNESW